MELTQVQMLSLLSLLFISVQKLNQEVRECFDGTPQTFALEERGKNWVLATARMKCC